MVELPVFVARCLSLDGNDVADVKNTCRHARYRCAAGSNSEAPGTSPLSDIWAVFHKVSLADITRSCVLKQLTLTHPSS